MARYIHNVSGETKYYEGVPVADNSFYQIPESMWSAYASNDNLISDITSEDVFISKDGVNNITTGVSDQIDYLKGINSLHTVKLDNQDPLGLSLVALQKPSGLSDGTLVSHDFCDKTTWYQNATEHTSITLSLSEGTTYKNASHTHWIDLTHGKLYGEDKLADQKEPIIYDNGVQVTSGFLINYEDGEVTFDSAPTGPVTADFWKAGDSTFTLSPDSNKVLKLEHAELQFAENINMSSPINFEIWVYNPADLPNKVLYKSIKYKNIKDIINAANLGQGYIPKISGLSQNVIVFPFNYISTKALKYSDGTELRISVDNDVEFSGEWATATFYFLSEDE